MTQKKTKPTEGKGIEDLIKVSKMPNANIELLMEDCYVRGFSKGEKVAKDFIRNRIIDLLK